MRTLIVYESMFGNTRAVAEAIAAGLADAGEVDLVAVESAPSAVPDDVDLLIVGGPTHALSMSRPATRAQAHERGASAPTAIGVREWLDGLPAEAGRHRLATFDTHAAQKWLPGSASKAAARSAHRHGLVAESTESFYVQDTEGPLSEGESERAAAWARSLIRT